ncbi:hypothetical protein BDV12DRAFT_172420 [Aspergillus spectabilis]
MPIEDLLLYIRILCEQPTELLKGLLVACGLDFTLLAATYLSDNLRGQLEVLHHCACRDIMRVVSWLLSSTSLAPQTQGNISDRPMGHALLQRPSSWPTDLTR